jgi:uncharacterized protein (DUF1800 family)
MPVTTGAGVVAATVTGGAAVVGAAVVGAAVVGAAVVGAAVVAMVAGTATDTGTVAVDGPVDGAADDAADVGVDATDGDVVGFVVADLLDPQPAMAMMAMMANRRRRISRHYSARTRASSEWMATSQPRRFGRSRRTHRRAVGAVPSRHGVWLVRAR